MADEVKVKLSQKSAVIILLVFVVFAAIFLILDKSGRWQQAPISQVKLQPTVNQQKLKVDYVSNLKSILSGYLDSVAAINLTSADFMDKTRVTSQRILALTVPAQYKDTHLSVALSLAQISQSNGNLTEIQSKLSTLRTLASSLQ